MSIKTASFVFRLFSVLMLFALLVSAGGVTSTVSAGTDVWTGNGPEGGIIAAIAIDPVTPTTLYAGTWGGGVFKSTNSGEHWSAVNTGLIATYVSDLAIDPAAPTTLYTGTDVGVFKSTNGGENWNLINTGFTNTHISALAIDPETSSTIYALALGGVFKSTNAGENWDAVNNGLTSTSVSALAIDPTTPSTLYAVASGSVFKSLNRGGNWSVISSGLTNIIVGTLAIDPITPSTLYAGTHSGVFKSTNAGISWSSVNNGLSDDTWIYTLVIDPLTPSTLYAGTNGQVFVSTNGGEEWSTTVINAYVRAFAIDPATPTTLYAGTDDLGMFKRVKGDGNWIAINNGLNAADVRALVMDPAAPATLFAGTIGGGVFKSTNSGGSWSTVNIGLTDTWVNALAVDPLAPTTLYAGTFGGVFKSTNGGGNWGSINNGLTTPIVTALAIDPLTPSTIYAGTNVGGVFKSTNGGGNWSGINTGLTDTHVRTLAIDPKISTTVYVGTGREGAFKSINGGENWDIANTGITCPSVNALIIDPATPTTLYAGTCDGVFKSTNSGRNWGASSAGMPSSVHVQALAINPAMSTTLYAGTDGTSSRVFKSTNGGGNWSAFSIGLTNSPVFALAIDPMAPSILYAGTMGSGVVAINNSVSVTSIARAGVTPTTATSVNFTVTFSESVTGVDIVGPTFDDFVLTNSSGISGAFITGVSGSGAIYTVTVNTGSGSGTIRLDIPTSASITDLAGNPLGNLPFNGDTYTINKPPVAAILTAPIGDIGTNYSPTYTWNKAADATYYHLYVSGPGGVVLDQWYQDTTICNTTTCSVTSPTLGSGAHVWYVQTWNSVGFGPWSNNSQPTNFSTTIPPLPAAAVLTAPIGNIGTNYNPTYTWNKVTNATWYHLYVSGPGGVVLDQWYQAINICNATTCSVASPTLGGGAHVWHVQPWNSTGYGSWSTAGNFSTKIIIAPAAAVLTAPIGDIGTNYNPTYTWDKVTDAAWYRLYVSGPNGVILDQWYQNTSICNASTCSVTSPTLGGGAHAWYVQTWNTAGYGPWSNNAQPTNFNTTIPPMPTAATLTAPIGNIGTNYNPTYTWNKAANATYYRLYVSGPSGVVLEQWYQAVSICNTTTCTVASPTLGGGAHVWYVQTWNSTGFGPWSNNSQPTNFNTTTIIPPTGAVLTAPSGTTANHTPTYTWNRVDMATWYHLYVSGPSGVIVDQWVQAANVCNATICSVVSPTLQSGDHTWWIQTDNVAGYGPWVSATFKVSP